MRREISTVDELRAIVGYPNEFVAKKVTDRLSPIQQDWLSRSPLGFVASTDADGRVDVSPKGDPPGFVHIIDDTTIAIPERPGNKRVDGHLNVLERPHVGTLFVVPGRGDTLRINGRARILADADWRSSRWRSPSRKCSFTAQGISAVGRLESGDWNPRCPAWPRSRTPAQELQPGRVDRGQPARLSRSAAGNAFRSG